MTFSKDAPFFYDSACAVTPAELQNLYRYTPWGKSRSCEEIARMLRHTDLCFSARVDDRLVAFCRMLTDFTYRASLWDLMVHSDYQGRGLGTRTLQYALSHPAVRAVPLIVAFSTDLGSFLARQGFVPRDGQMMLLRRPLEYC